MTKRREWEVFETGVQMGVRAVVTASIPPGSRYQATNGIDAEPELRALRNQVNLLIDRAENAEEDARSARTDAVKWVNEASRQKQRADAAEERGRGYLVQSDGLLDTLAEVRRGLAKILQSQGIEANASYSVTGLVAQLGDYLAECDKQAEQCEHVAKGSADYLRRMLRDRHVQPADSIEEMLLQLDNMLAAWGVDGHRRSPVVDRENRPENAKCSPCGYNFRDAVKGRC